MVLEVVYWSVKRCATCIKSWRRLHLPNLNIFVFVCSVKIKSASTTWARICQKRHLGQSFLRWSLNFWRDHSCRIKVQDQTTGGHRERPDSTAHDLGGVCGSALHRGMRLCYDEYAIFVLTPQLHWKICRKYLFVSIAASYLHHASCTNVCHEDKPADQHCGQNHSQRTGDTIG